jgi:hypothetical protein
MDMSAAYRDGIATGVIAGILIELVRFSYAHREALANLLKGRRRKLYSHLSGEWFQYHLTMDKKKGKGPIWVAHKETLVVSQLFKVTGGSQNDYETPLQYKILGRIVHGRMIFQYSNELLEEDRVTVVINNLLSGKLLLGTWSGQDFNKVHTTGPIVFSRTPLSEDKLDEILATPDDIMILNRRTFG